MAELPRSFALCEPEKKTSELDVRRVLRSVAWAIVHAILWYLGGSHRHKPRFFTIFSICEIVWTCTNIPLKWWSKCFLAFRTLPITVYRSYFHIVGELARDICANWFADLHEMSAAGDPLFFTGFFSVWESRCHSHHPEWLPSHMDG